MLLLHNFAVATLQARNHATRHCEPRSAAEWEAIPGVTQLPSLAPSSIVRLTGEASLALRKQLHLHICTFAHLHIALRAPPCPRVFVVQKNLAPLRVFASLRQKISSNQKHI